MELLRRLAFIGTAVALALGGYMTSAEAAPVTHQESSAQLNIQGPKGKSAGTLELSKTNTASTSATPADEIPIDCASTSDLWQGTMVFNPDPPNELEQVQWFDDDTVVCNIPMTSIEMEVSAIDPQGSPHVIGDATCGFCDGVDALPTGYVCDQETAVEDGVTCVGPWEVAYDEIIVAPPGEEFTTGTGDCVAEGATGICTTVIQAGTVRQFE